MSNGYYIVVNKDRGPSDRPYTHMTLKAAKAEAERLARIQVGATFIVFASLISVTRDDMRIKNLVPSDHDAIDDGIPF